MVHNFHSKRLTVSLASILCLFMSPSFADEVGQLKSAENALTAKRYIEAEKILRPLADGGNPTAEWMLGELYMHGRGVQRNYTKAKDLWEKAVAAGDQKAMYSLALSSNPFGPKESAKVADLLEKSASLGYSKAQYWMGLICFWGFGTRKDTARAVDYLKAGANRGNGDAECLLSYFYENGLGVPKDAHTSKKLTQLRNRI